MVVRSIASRRKRFLTRLAKTTETLLTLRLFLPGKQGPVCDIAVPVGEDLALRVLHRIAEANGPEDVERILDDARDEYERANGGRQT